MWISFREQADDSKPPEEASSGDQSAERESRASASVTVSSQQSARDTSREKAQTSMDKYLTPNKGAQSKGIQRSPPTPTEVLHDKQSGKKTKKRKSKSKK